MTSRYTHPPIRSRENKQDKARRYLCEGRLTVLEVNRITGFIRAIVKGDGALHRVRHDGGEWHCSCPALRRCSHLLAVGLVVAPETQSRKGYR